MAAEKTSTAREMAWVPQNSREMAGETPAGVRSARTIAMAACGRLGGNSGFGDDCALGLGWQTGPRAWGKHPALLSAAD